MKTNMRIEKKTWHKSFQAILDGSKTFDVRLADWECNVGDVLVLREWDPESKQYTGRVLEKTVTYISKSKNLPNYFKQEDIDKYGIQILAIK